MDVHVELISSGCGLPLRIHPCQACTHLEAEHWKTVRAGRWLADIQGQSSRQWPRTQAASVNPESPCGLLCQKNSSQFSFNQYQFSYATLACSHRYFLHGLPWSTTNVHGKCAQRIQFRLQEDYPLSSVTRTLTPVKSVRRFPVKSGTEIEWWSSWLGFSGRPSLTLNVTVVPLPSPSLSTQIWPSIKFINLQYDNKPLSDWRIYHAHTSTASVNLAAQYYISNITSILEK